MTPRRWTVLAIVATLIILFPLRLAIAFAAPEGVSARAAAGLLWSGRVDQLHIGALNLGTIDTGVAPLPLFVGRIALPFTRAKGWHDAPIEGRISTGIGGQRIEGLTGTLNLTTGKLPISDIQLVNFAMRISDDGCQEASGRVQVTPAITIPGIDLRNGLAGEAKCENGILVLPLTGQSGMETLTIRIRRNGQYEARLAVRADTPEMSQALAAAGFAPGEGGFGMTLTGRL